ncbi:MAG: lasso peptide biosynthesis B2 protein [Propionibacteriales bacterium]|nr:lasso peptide biosynthesis B2 protein [Propionibacteriales bacterium]
MGLSRLAILVLPFAAVRRALGEHRAPVASAEDPSPPLDEAALLRARRIGATVQLAARHTPWRSECYPQALTARLLLGLARVPHVVSFGVRRDGDALVAHAWVHAGGLTVTGGTGHRYTEVGAFAWAPRARKGG